MNRAQLLAALKNADAAASAGDQEAAADARKLADMLRSLPAEKAAPERDQFHMVKPEARARVAAAQGQRVLPISPLGPGNERYAPKPPPAQNDPLAASPETAAANIDAQQRARGLVPYTYAATGETYWRPDPARQIADANAQFRARETAKAANAQAQAELEAWRKGNFLGVPNTARESVSNAVKGGLATIENGVFDTVDAGIDLVDPQRNLSRFVSETVTPATEAAGRRIGEIIDGPSGRFAGMAGPLMGSIAGGVSEWGATMARDPQQGLTEAVDMLEPTHQLARGSNTAGSAINAAAIGDGEKARQLMLEATPDLLAGGLGVLPVGSFTVNAMRNAAMAPTREMAEQLARIPARNAQGAPMPVVRGGGGAPPPPPGATPPAVSPARSRAEQRADDIFIRKLQADGLTIDDVRKVQASLARRGDSGVYETSGELAALSGKSSGANLRGLQMAGGAAPGPLQEALISRVNENATKLPDRLSRAATRATGQNADNAVATLDELDARLRTEATPAYDEAYATPPDPVVFQNEILPVLNTPSGQEAIKAARNNLAAKAAELQGRAARGASDQAMREWNRAQEAVASIDAYLADPVRGTAIPTTMALDYTKRAFDDVIAKAGFGSDTARIVGGTKRSFADSVSQATGGKYGNALGVYSDVKSLEDAFETGLKALSQKTWQLQRDMAKGRNGTPYSGGEIEAIAMGVARAIEDMIEAGDNRALTALTKDKALKNIATALGSEEAAAKFEQSIRRLAANREWGRRVAGGSDTAMRQAAIRDAGMEGEDAVTRVLDRVETSGNQISLPGIVNDIAVKPLARTAKDIYQRLRYPGVYDEEVNRALVPLLSTPMTKGNLDEVIRRVEARLAEKGKTQASKVATASSAKATSGKTTTTPASATVTGVVSGGIGGALLPAETEEDQFVNALFGAAVVGGVAGGAAKLARGRGSSKPPPAPRGAGRRNPPPAPRTPPGAPPVQSGFGGGRKLPMQADIRTGPPTATKPSAGNKHGLEPSFREVAKLKAGTSINKAERPPVTKAFTPGNADKQLANIDRLLANHPAPEASSNAWSRMMADMVGDVDAPIPPHQFLKDMKNGGEGAIERLKTLTPEQIAEADHGFHQADEFRQAYINGDMRPTDTTKLFMWSFLSRGVSPYVQESMFLDAFKGADEWIEHAVNGTFDGNVLSGYKKWASEVSPAGSGLPGSGTQHNLNAFGEHFLRKMAQRADDGETYLKKLHDMIADPNMTGPEIRRAFSKFPEGIGIDNKVVSFTLLASGRKDVMVLDRIQVRALFNDGRFGSRNIYDPLKEDGAAVAGTALADITYGAYGVVLYEAIERALAKQVDAIYAAVGRPQDASIGRYHWDTWNAASGQEASHGTLGAILKGAKKSDKPLAGIRAKEGEYGSYAYNSEYGISADGERTFHYTTPKGSTYEFSVPAYREFIAEVKKAKNGVVPSNFKVTQSGNAPWTSRPEVNTDALDALAARYADRSTGERAGRRSGSQSAGGSALPGNGPSKVAGGPKRLALTTSVPQVRRPKPPPQTMSFSSKLLAGTGANATGLGGAGGAVAGAAFAPDTNGDGVIDAQERMAGGFGGLVSGLVGGAGANKLLGPRRGVSKAAPARRFRAPDQQTFAGVNAKTADKVALARAQNMEAEGASRDAIWDETGWFKGVDGKWRFEIDDSGAKLNPILQRGEVDSWSRADGISLGEVMPHPALYEAYPDLAKVPTSGRVQTPLSSMIDNIRDPKAAQQVGAVRGGYGPEGVYLNAPIEDIRSTALHEGAGHGVQDIEGFARGGTVAPGFVSPDEIDFSQIAPLMQKYGIEGDDLGVDAYGFLDAVKRDLQASGASADEVNVVVRETQRLAPKLQDAQLKANQDYRRLAGEAEARNIQTRDAMRMRGEKPGRPWETQDVPDDQQIVRFGSGKAESRAAPKAGPQKPPAQSGFGGGPRLRGTPDGGQRVPLFRTTSGDEFSANLYVADDGGISFHPSYPNDTMPELANALNTAAKKPKSPLLTNATREAAKLLNEPKFKTVEGGKASEAATWADANLSQVGPDDMARIGPAVLDRMAGIVRSNPGAPRYVLELGEGVDRNVARRQMRALARETDMVFAEAKGGEEMVLIARDFYNQNRGRYRQFDVSYTDPSSPPAQSGFGGGSPKPPPGIPPKAKPKAPSTIMGSAVGRAATGGVVGGAVGALAGEAGGQEPPLVNEFLAPLEQERDRIKKLEAELNILENGTVSAKQKYLAETRGLKISKDGQPDGILGDATRAAIAQARTELETAITVARSSVEALSGKAEKRRAEIEMKAAYDRTKPSGFAELARELGPWVGIGAGVLAGTLMRKGAVAKNSAQSATKAAALNRLVSSETPTTWDTMAGRKAMGKRTTNLNEFFYQGGAGKPDNLKQRLGLEPKKGVPFTKDANGDWMAKPNAKDPFDLFKPGTKHFKMMDFAVIGAAMAESEFAGNLAKGFHEEAKQAQAAVDKAQEEGNAANLEIAMARLESAKNAEAAAIAFQRFGQVAALARTAGAFKMPYEYTRPNVKKAEADQALILDAIRRSRNIP